MTPAKLYIWILCIAFGILASIMLFMPRSKYSVLEKRDLAEFPNLTLQGVSDASYARSISGWFSDTEPFRDDFMSANMKVRDAIRLSFAGQGGEAISFHKKGDANSHGGTDQGGADASQLEEYKNNINAAENARIGGAGIIIVGSGKTVRALNAFGGSADGGRKFAGVVSRYQRELPGVRVYAMVIPLSSEFYTPDKAKSVTKPQQPFIKNIYSHLTDGARGVNAYNVLADHVKEDIYLRTDHHWAPLGAFYAAEEFAKTAGVSFKPLSAYTKKVIHNFVGSMYGYSNDIAVKKAPEDFIYYVPNGLNYTTIYQNYDVNRDYKVVKEHPPVKGSYFMKYNDGSGAAYSTFMGGDQKLTTVKTGLKTGRKLIVIKDSYGNALPGYLFFSFDEIHIVDFRYFTHNMKKYVRDNGITDVVFCVNVFNAFSSSAAGKMADFLTQGEGTFASPSDSGRTESDGEERKNGSNNLKEDLGRSARTLKDGKPLHNSVQENTEENETEDPIGNSQEETGE